LAGPQRTLSLLLGSSVRRSSGLGALNFDGTCFGVAAEWRLAEICIVIVVRGPGVVRGSNG